MDGQHSRQSLSLLESVMYRENGGSAASIKHSRSVISTDTHVTHQASKSKILPKCLNNLENQICGLSDNTIFRVYPFPNLNIHNSIMSNNPPKSDHCLDLETGTEIWMFPPSSDQGLPVSFYAQSKHKLKALIFWFAGLPYLPTVSDCTQVNR